MIRGLFISGVSTAVGKTFLSRGLTRALRRSNRSVAALKPIETGVTDEPSDAVALARTCGQPELARSAAFYRHPLPLAPYAATLQDGSEPPGILPLAEAVQTASGPAEYLIVEGAGGLLVPLDARNTNAELAAALRLPLLLVARDELGVLASVLSCAESARSRSLGIAAVVLTRHTPIDLAADPSPATNARILTERLGVPVLRFGPCPDDDDALAAEAERSGLLDLMR